MLRRLKYISVFAHELEAEQIEALVRKAAERNAQIDVTGILLATGRLFFQIIEGPEKSIDSLFLRIQKDPRHHSILVLRDEREVNERLFPEWSMRKFDLSGSARARMRPMFEILESIQQLRQTTERLANALELAIWREMIDL